MKKDDSEMPSKQPDPDSEGILEELTGMKFKNPDKINRSDQDAIQVTTGFKVLFYGSEPRSK